MTVSSMLDSAGRRRSPATLPGFHSARAPRNKGMLYPADPPRSPELAVQIVGGADQRQVREGLGKLPSCSPVGPISSEYSPTWLA